MSTNAQPVFNFAERHYQNFFLDPVNNRDTIPLIVQMGVGIDEESLDNSHGLIERGRRTLLDARITRLVGSWI